MTDFRLRRFRLRPEAFAIGPEVEPDPTDLIDERTWSELLTLPDDVSLRTTEHHGSAFRCAEDIWGHWTGLVLDVQSLLANPRDDALALACLNVGDELQASIHAALTGFYRQAIAGLRSAVEGVVAGAYFRAYPDFLKFQQWADGERAGRLGWQEMRRKLAATKPYSQFDAASKGTGLFAKDGWANALYDHLSGFSHGRPAFVDTRGSRVPSTNVELWGGSNGPVYEASSVRLFSRFYSDVALFCLLLVGLADPRVVTVPKPTDVAFEGFVTRVVACHFGPFPTAAAIIKFLTN